LETESVVGGVGFFWTPNFKRWVSDFNLALVLSLSSTKVIGMVSSADANLVVFHWAWTGKLVWVCAQLVISWSINTENLVIVNQMRLAIVNHLLLLLKLASILTGIFCCRIKLFKFVDFHTLKFREYISLV